MTVFRKLSKAQLMIFVLYKYKTIMYDQHKKSNKHIFIEEVEQFIKENIENEINVEILAKAFHVSERQLHRNIKSAFALTPAKLIKEIRLQTAMTFIQEGRYSTITEVALNAGFKHPTTFATLFKQRFGNSPSELMD